MSNESSDNGRRITLKHRQANPLFQMWLEQLHNEAKMKKSKLEPMLKEALLSISKYPLPLSCGADCAILKGFDTKLCNFLDKYLEIHCREECDQSSPNSNSSCEDAGNCTPPIPKKQKQKEHSSQLTSQDENMEPKLTKVQTLRSSKRLSQLLQSKSLEENRSSVPQTNINVSPSLNIATKSRGCTSYKPSYRSGGYAILITLAEHLKNEPNNPFLNKDQLIENAQKHCEESFTRKKPDSFYTAWSSMSKLIEKGLIEKHRSKYVMYTLTSEGITLANELLKEGQTRPTMNDIIFNEPSTSKHNVPINNEIEASNEIIACNIVNRDTEIDRNTAIDSDVNSEESSILINMPVGSFDVILLIDKNETSGLSKRNDPTVAQFKKYPDLKHEYRSLKVGDFCWIARDKVNSEQELVLPYVIERKRMDDLAASIKDGRFHEQKFRLRKCGLKNIIYMVENYGSNKHLGLPKQNLMQALANTRIQDKFKVHITNSLNDSVRFLAMLTKRLSIEYENKTLQGCTSEPKDNQFMTFIHFNKSAIKNKPLTVKDTFIKLLLQLKGVSVEKALAITEVYNTPKSLINAYKQCDENEGISLLVNLKCGDLNRNVGPSVSKAVYQLFCIKNPI